MKTNQRHLVQLCRWTLFIGFLLIFASRATADTTKVEREELQRQMEVAAQSLKDIAKSKIELGRILPWKGDIRIVFHCPMKCSGSFEAQFLTYLKEAVDNLGESHQIIEVGPSSFEKSPEHYGENFVVDYWIYNGGDAAVSFADLYEQQFKEEYMNISLPESPSNAVQPVPCWGITLASKNLHDTLFSYQSINANAPASDVAFRKCIYAALGYYPLLAIADSDEIARRIGSLGDDISR